MRRLSKVTEAGHERIPVFRVGLTSNTTLRTLNRMICEYYGHPATDRANAAALASHALDCVLSCETQLGIVDDSPGAAGESRRPVTQPRCKSSSESPESPVVGSIAESACAPALVALRIDH
ncbi:hypothetical protein GCM10010207_65030 [Streptomyces atratus]|nr:hypothetical protein GCM10010207_65030 [Streptomyces atratus]